MFARVNERKTDEVGLANVEHVDPGKELFKRYVAENGYQFADIREGTKRGRTPDLRVSVCQGGVYCEVKTLKFSPTDVERLEKGALVGQPRELSFWRDITEAAGQLRGYAPHPCLIVVVVDTPYLFPDWLTCDRGYGNALQSQCHVSAVAFLEQFSPHKATFDALLAVACDLKHASPEERYVAHERIAREHPDVHPEFKVLRLYVCENPHANTPLPRDVLRGPLDCRWALSNDGTRWDMIYGPR